MHLCYFIANIFFNDNGRSRDGATTVARILYQNYFIIFAVFLGVSQNSLLKIVKRLIYYYGMNSFGFRDRQIKDELYFLFEIEKKEVEELLLDYYDILKIDIFYLTTWMRNIFVCFLHVLKSPSNASNS